MKFKIDENLPSETVEVLGSSGHDALTVGDQGLNGASDPSVARACAAEDRVLLTLDVGFADIRAYPPGSHPGIIVLRPARQDKSNVLSIIGRLLGSLEAEPLAGKLWVVDENRVRVRE